MQLATGNDPVVAPPVEPGRGSWTVARLMRGLVFFLALTAVGFWIASRRGALGSNGLAALRSVHPVALIVGCLQALLDQLLGGLRIWFCARAIGESIALWPCALANTANVFMGGVTPSQHGGGAGQIWILLRSGMTFTAATVTSAFAYLGTVGFFLVLACVLLVHGRGVLPVVGGLQLFTSGALLLFAGTMGLAALALPHPDAVTRALRAVLQRIPRLGPRLAASSGVRRLERFLADYSQAARRALRRGRLSLLAAALLSGLIYINKFLVAYVVVRGLGSHPSVRDVLHVQAVQSLVTYFAPTPGASGVAEVAASELMRRIVPDASMGAYIVLWRTMSLYLGMALGAVTVVLSGFATFRAPASTPGTSR